MKLNPSSRAEKSLDVFRPSEYTCLVLQYLQDQPEVARERRACEIGTGNGVIAAQAAMQGASAVVVSDIEDQALAAAKDCLASLDAPSCSFEFHLGPMWSPFANRRFDLILATLPQFPCEASVLSDRLHSWSVGGSDGRALLDRFVAGLDEHLAVGGRAVFAHNSFVGLDKTRAVVEAAGLEMTVERAVTVLLAPTKVAALPLGLAAYAPHIYPVGNYVFGHVSLAVVCKNH